MERANGIRAPPTMATRRTTVPASMGRLPGVLGEALRVQGSIAALTRRPSRSGRDWSALLSLRDPARTSIRHRGARAMSHLQLRAADGQTFSAYVAKPEGKARGAIVVIQEIFGVDSATSNEWPSSTLRRGISRSHPRSSTGRSAASNLPYDDDGVARGIGIHAESRPGRAHRRSRRHGRRGDARRRRRHGGLLLGRRA